MRKHMIWPLAAALVATAPAQDAAPTYQLPPDPIVQILDTAPTPTPSISPDKKVMALLGRANLPPIAELAEPMLRLAGTRINPRNNGPANSRIQWLNALSFTDIASGAVREIALPVGARFMAGGWSPDSRYLAILIDQPEGLALHVADTTDGSLRQLTGPVVNAAFGVNLEWLPDSSGLLVPAIVEGRGAAPVANAVPAGPLVEVNEGRAAPARTYQDLLTGPADEALFDYYFTAQLMRVPVDGSAAQAIGAPGILSTFTPSPDGQYILISRIKRPYSTTVPAGLFAYDVTVTDMSGTEVHKAADVRLRDDIPPPFDAVEEGPRQIQWRSDAPATLAWVEAQDGGDPNREAAVRDTLFIRAAPFTGAPVKLADFADRFAGISWGNDTTAIGYGRFFNTRHETRLLIDPSKPGTTRVLADRNYQDRYGDPGSPVMVRNAAGRQVLQMSSDGAAVFLSGAGATREGEFPFLDRLELASGTATRLWQSDKTHYETVIGINDADGANLLTRREGPSEPPNIFIRDVATGETKALTNFPDPAPQFAGVTREMVTYTRADGVSLSGTLYLPAGYDKTRDGRLPLLMWAYPAEFTDAKVAGQVVDTQNRFVRPGGMSHLFLLTQGYAILDNPTMPIVGADGAEPNDTYVAQLSASAEAAVKAVVDMGVADADKIAIGGHSYGAFMTANLLAHTDLFRTGIARSGAYNRTLTPFGFQAEQRTYWEAVPTYTEMSPFTHANKINEPILLIHGAADSNSGTFPIQSERFYAALKGNGVTARYVVLPLEDHGYRARESVLHTLYEMTAWMDKYVKNAPPRAAQ